MLYLVEFHKKINPFKMIKVFESTLYRKFESLGKCSDAGIDIRNLIFVTHNNYSKTFYVMYTANIIIFL